VCEDLLYPKIERRTSVDGIHRNETASWHDPNMNPTLIDLFAGCGGMTAGFVAEGFEPVAAVEWDVAAAATYAANFGEDHMICSDITDWRRGIPKADVVIGGPPCQGFSNLGTKDPDDPRNHLWAEYMRIVLAARPKVFVIENVDRFAKSPEFELLVSELRTGRLRAWKHWDWRVLNAADYGVPQRRNRAILVASRIGPVSLPAATHSKVGGDGTEKWCTVDQAFDGVSFESVGTELPKSKTHFFGELISGVFKSTEIHIGRNPKPSSLERYNYIPPGGGRFDLPAHLMPRCWANKPTGTTDVMGRMRWDEPSLTIRTEFFKPEKGQYLHPQWDAHSPKRRVNRPITHREAALLQSFPHDYLWCGSKIEIARQIGNAVPCALAGALARSIRSSV
jgi:DNA (cytosine-5)-methyltransferase 1